MSEASYTVPARRIDAPASVSPEARAYLSMLASVAPPPGTSRYPADPGDVAAWAAVVARSNASMATIFAGAAAKTRVREIGIAGVTVFEIEPPGLSRPGKVVFDVHGGGLIAGGGEVCKETAANMALRSGALVWSPDYRMPPEHPYPAAIDDTLAAYRALVGRFDPSDIIVTGGSAGANIASATLLRARDEGLPLPAGAILLTPELDLSESGDSFQTNAEVDLILGATLMPANRLYAADADLRHPYVSPLFGNFSKGFPPTFLSSGTRDLFLSNAVRMHWALRNVGIDAELFVIEASSHDMMPGTPENAALNREILRFIEERWAC